MKTTDVPANLREFIKVFNRVAGYRWDATQVFSDFIYYCIECFTIEKDTEFIDRLKRNYGDEYEVFPLLFREMVLTTHRELEHVEWFDVLGTIYEVVASGSKKSSMGQFFTPPSICDLMTSIQYTEKVVGKTVNDPSCGSGRTLLSFHAAHPGNFLFGEDLDALCSRMCVVNFVLHGAIGQVQHMNSLSMEWYAGWETGLFTIRRIEKSESRTIEMWEKRARKPEPKPEVILPVVMNKPGTQLTIF